MTSLPPGKLNILVTGTPGTGKTTLCELVAEESGINHINISDVVKNGKLYEEWDDEYDSYIIDEDKVIDELEDVMVGGFNIVDHHSSDWFPERWFNLIVVLRADNEVLYERLEGRGYEGKKLEDNIDCEIMRVCLDEALNSYDPSLVIELNNDSMADMKKNVATIIDWIEDAKKEQDD